MGSEQKLCVIVIFAILITAVDVASISQGDEDVIKIAVVQHNFEPLYIADELGFFEDEGVNVELVVVGSGSLSASALATGRVDLAGFGPDPILSLMNSYGYDYQIVARYMLDDGLQGAARISANIDLDDANTLIGKKIGVNTSISYYSLLLEYFERAGVDDRYTLQSGTANYDPSKINVYNTPNNMLSSSLRTGTVDMIIGGANNAIVVEGDTSTFEYVSPTDPDLKSYMPVSLLASKDTIVAKEGQITRVLRAVQRACEYINDPATFDDACRIAIDSLGNRWGMEVQTKYFDSAEWGLAFDNDDVVSMNVALSHQLGKYPNLSGGISAAEYFEPRFLMNILGDSFIWPIGG